MKESCILYRSVSQFLGLQIRVRNLFLNYCTCKNKPAICCPQNVNFLLKLTMSKGFDWISINSPIYVLFEAKFINFKVSKIVQVRQQDRHAPSPRLVPAVEKHWCSMPNIYPLSIRNISIRTSKPLKKAINSILKINEFIHNIYFLIQIVILFYARPNVPGTLARRRLEKRTISNAGEASCPHSASPSPSADSRKSAEDAWSSRGYYKMNPNSSIIKYCKMTASGEPRNFQKGLINTNSLNIKPLSYQQIM